MTFTKTLLALSFLSLLFIMPVQAQTCKVTDPTGSQLNVRSSAAGKVTGKLSNGKVVYITDLDYDDKGKPWVLIFDAKNDNYIGWVFREFVSCY
ncbi:SH3 domain-containing protein [Psychrobacter immobilis]|uniref:SH3 domain-containing protein n=1 Tax=Psychrobacter immobilis TaxID=498 RepID=UPI00191B085C|nr:SH3 domain-containing protein [Psychrobacter immobilis]